MFSSASACVTANRVGLAREEQLNVLNDIQ